MLGTRRGRSGLVKAVQRELEGTSRGPGIREGDVLEHARVSPADAAEGPRL